MGLLERGRRRTLQELDPSEVVVASLSGVEAHGRRRRFVLLTDRRLLVGSTRGEAPVELGLDDLEAEMERSTGILTLRCAAERVALRDVDEVAARALVAVVAHHRRSTWPDDPSTPMSVQVRSAATDEAS
jgi:hypothetical protein